MAADSLAKMLIQLQAIEAMHMFHSSGSLPLKGWVREGCGTRVPGVYPLPSPPLKGEGAGGFVSYRLAGESTSEPGLRRTARRIGALLHFAGPRLAAWFATPGRSPGLALLMLHRSELGGQFL
jgi:hypothetical protein